MAEAFSSLLLLAVMVEFLTEALRENIPLLQRLPAGWIAVLLGVLLCWLTDTGLLQVIGDYRRSPYFDYAITGLAISRGSSVLHTLIGVLKDFRHRAALRPLPEQSPAPAAVAEPPGRALR